MSISLIRRKLQAGCELYCSWYDTGKPEMSPASIAYELVSSCRGALAALDDVEAELKRLSELCRQQQLQIECLQGVDPNS